MLLHELGHKFTALRYRLYTEFRSFPKLMFISFLMAFTGFTFMVFGGVYHGRVQYMDDEAMIALNGPLLNILIGGAAALLYMAGLRLRDLPLIQAAVVNGFLAFLNLLPIPGFDGWYVIRVLPLHWLLVFASSIGITVWSYIIFFKYLYGSIF